MIKKSYLTSLKSGSSFLVYNEILLPNRCHEGALKPRKSSTCGLFEPMKIIPTRQMDLISKYFCLDDLIPFDMVWFALSISCVFSEFLLSKSYQGMLQVSEKRSFSYLYYTSYPWNMRGLFTKIHSFSNLVNRMRL